MKIKLLLIVSLFILIVQSCVVETLPDLEPNPFVNEDYDFFWNEKFNFSDYSAFYRNVTVSFSSSYADMSEEQRKLLSKLVVTAPNKISYLNPSRTSFTDEPHQIGKTVCYTLLFTTLEEYTLNSTKFCKKVE
jgi:hypothetical protein